jgi:hypothetical protein
MIFQVTLIIYYLLFIILATILFELIQLVSEKQVRCTPIYLKSITKLTGLTKHGAPACALGVFSYTECIRLVYVAC